MRAIVEAVRCHQAPQTPLEPKGFGGVASSAARRTLDDEHRCVGLPRDITFAHGALHLEPSAEASRGTALELSRAGVSPQAAWSSVAGDHHHESLSSISSPPKNRIARLATKAVTIPCKKAKPP